MDAAGAKEARAHECSTIYSVEKLESAGKSPDQLGNAPPRTLHVRDIVAAAFNVCNSWAGIAATLFLGISAGGPVSVIYGIIVSSVMVGCCVVSMAELAARYPTAGGQYHWAWLLSPHGMRRGMSYITGIINIFAWMSVSASVCVVQPSIILGLATYWYPNYVSQRWQEFLIYQASNIIILMYNIGILHRATWTHNVGMALSLLMIFTYFIVCLSRASPKLPSSYVWTEFVNDPAVSGWSDGVVFLTSLVNPHFGYVGIDGALHLAEDARNAVKAVPLGLMITVLIGFFTAFPFAVAMFYCISDPASVLESPLPIFEIWRQAVRSASGATAMTVFLSVSGYFALNASQQTASRLTWSFARDRALVFSKAIGTIHPTLEVPVWALLANALVVSIIGCVYLGSSTAFNAIVATSLILLHMTFAITAGLKMLQGRSSDFLPDTSAGWPAKIGVLGWLFDFITVAWGLVVLVFYCFPTTKPTTGTSANYAAAVLVVMALFGLINWFAYARKRYKGPRVNLDSFREVKMPEKKLTLKERNAGCA